MTNIELLMNLKEFYDLCVRTGWSEVKRFEDIMQLWAPVRGKMGKLAIRHFFKPIMMNLNIYHWVDPKTASKLVKQIEDLLKYKDQAYLSVTMNQNGTKYMVEALNIDGTRKVMDICGRKRKRVVLKLFFFPPIHVLIISWIDQLIKKIKERRDREVLKND